MLQQNNSSVLSTVSPPNTFQPRQEFRRDSHIASTFSLLSIANANSVRLTSFAGTVVTALGTYFEDQKILAGVREEPKLNLVELKLEGKPWAQNKKFADTEKLFLDILAIIFQQGYRFLSTIDYGRESSERVSIAFSKPVALSPFEATRVPFALSFPTSTTLRVVNAPLNSSPAILQAARTAWPRGVVSEKKISDRCFEFRLKGYRWFQEDNFASDSLQHILALLNALDRYAFTLLTSISLTGAHSRVKDLWIFSGSPLDPTNEQTNSGSNLELSAGSSPTGSKQNVDVFGRSTPSPLPNRSLDAVAGQPTLFPATSKEAPHPMGHARSATEPTASPARSGSLLRKKPPPRGGTSPDPQGYRRSSEEFPLRHQQNLAAIDVVDMTGVGSATQQRFYRSQPSPGMPVPSPTGGPQAYVDLTQERPRVKTGDIFYETPGAADAAGAYDSHARRRSASTPELLADASSRPRYPSPGRGSTSSRDSRLSSRQLTPRDGMSVPTHPQRREPASDIPQNVTGREGAERPAIVSEARTESSLNMMPILGPTAFRDSAFSSSTGLSCEIPIAWTGPDSEKEKAALEQGILLPGAERDVQEGLRGVSPGLNLNATDEARGFSRDAYPSPMPKFPGGWAPTPIEEKPEEQYTTSSPVQVQDIDRQQSGSPERKEVDAERVASPTYDPDQRKSEVAMYGMAPSPNPRRESVDRARDSKTTTGSPTKSDGWVLVNVADDAPASPTSPAGKQGSRAASPSSNSERAKSPSGSQREREQQQPAKGSSLSPIAKAIVVQDAAKPPATSNPKEKEVSGIRRIFSRSKTQKVKEQEAKSKKASIRDRLRKKTADSA